VPPLQWERVGRVGDSRAGQEGSTVADVKKKPARKGKREKRKSFSAWISDGECPKDCESRIREGVQQGGRRALGFHASSERL